MPTWAVEARLNLAEFGWQKKTAVLVDVFQQQVYESGKEG